MLFTVALHVVLTGGALGWGHDSDGLNCHIWCQIDYFPGAIPLVRLSEVAMAAHCQDVILLFGDSLTQRSWDPELKGIGSRLASMTTM
jgi:hypothetical protein